MYLTAAEQSIFERLPDAVRRGWSIETQPPFRNEDPDDLYLRFRMADFSDERLKSLADTFAAGASTNASFDAFANQCNLSSFDQEQIAELFFVLGTGMLTGFLRYVLENADSDTDAEEVASLSNIRRMLIETNNES